jgi:cell division protein FtsB
MQFFTKRQWSILGLILLLLLICIGLRIFRPNPNVERVRKMRAELFAASARNLSPAERREKMDAFRKEQEKLTPAERSDLFDDARKRRDAQLERYAKLSREEKLQFLDERIDQMQARGPGRPGDNGRGPGNPSGGQGSSSYQSDDDREHRRRQMLDSTTPEQRALRDNFMKDFRARLAQRGVPNPPWGLR